MGPYAKAPMVRSASKRMDGALTVLMVDDDSATCCLFQQYLIDAGFIIRYTHTIENALDHLKEDPVDIILLDMSLGRADGIEEMPRLIAASPTSRIWVLTANSSIHVAVRAMRNGATGFLSKDQDIPEIIEELKAGNPLRFEPGVLQPFQESEALTGLLGQSPAIQRVRQNIYRMKDVDSTVLVTGESGTGKELIARSLHRVSRRSGEKFAALNCGAIPENLLESELFGHRRGAFTDAKTERKGYFELCRDGTLFLDEIGELPLLLQVKLLRALQEKEIQPIGSSHTIKVNTRVIASTNRNLSEEVTQGRFREDLYYRLSVLSINAPPLRERREDIPLLAEAFCKRFSSRFNKEILPLSQEIKSRLWTYEWPGNVRELQNAIERAVILTANNELHLEDIFQFLPGGSEQKKPEHNVSREKPFSEVAEYSHALQEFEKTYISKLLRATNGNISEASRISGEYRPHLYRLLKKYRINPLEFKN